MSRIVLCVCLLIACWAPFAGAGQHLIELRLGGAITATDPDDLNEQLQSLNLESNSLSGFNVDVFVNIPLLPIGAGLRYEWASQSESASAGTGFELDVQNLSLLVDWRILDNELFYVGPLLTLGYPTGEIKLSDAGNLNQADIDPDQISFALAVEGGLIFKRFIVGAELGYKSLKLEPPGFLQVVPEINMSGFFGRLQLGVGIF